MHRNHLLLATSAATSLLALGAARADADCTLRDVNVSITTYWDGAGRVANDQRCTGNFCKLQAWVIAPRYLSTTTPNKTIVMPHGSGVGAEDTAGVESVKLDAYCELIHKFVDDGFVVVYPLRRGVYDMTSDTMVNVPGFMPHRFSGDSGGYFANTGMSEQDYADVAGANHAYLITEYMKKEADIDFVDVLAHLSTLMVTSTTHLVDTNHIAVVGHSFGGAFTTIASANTYPVNDPKVYVSLSGAAMSYGSMDPDPNSPWHKVLRDRAAAHKRPIYFQMSAYEDPAADFDSDVDSNPAPHWVAAQQPYNAAKVSGKTRLHLSKFDATCTTGEDAQPDHHHHCVHAKYVSTTAGFNDWYADAMSFIYLWI